MRMVHAHPFLSILRNEPNFLNVAADFLLRRNIPSRAERMIWRSFLRNEVNFHWRSPDFLLRRGTFQPALKILCQTRVRASAIRAYGKWIVGALAVRIPARAMQVHRSAGMTISS